MTEGVLVRDIERAVAQLEALRALGVRIAMDDGGTGFSGLSYLRNLPADIFKIDRSPRCSASRRRATSSPARRLPPT